MKMKKEHIQLIMDMTLFIGGLYLYFSEKLDGKTIFYLANIIFILKRGIYKNME